MSLQQTVVYFFFKEIESNKQNLDKLLIFNIDRSRLKSNWSWYKLQNTLKSTNGFFFFATNLFNNSLNLQNAFQPKILGFGLNWYIFKFSIFRVWISLISTVCGSILKICNNSKFCQFDSISLKKMIALLFFSIRHVSFKYFIHRFKIYFSFINNF